MLALIHQRVSLRQRWDENTAAPLTRRLKAADPQITSPFSPSPNDSALWFRTTSSPDPSRSLTTNCSFHKCASAGSVFIQLVSIL